MKKLFTLIGAVLISASVFAADRWTNTVVMAIGETNVTSDIALYRGGGAPCNEIDSIFVTVDSGNGTGTVSFATLDAGVATTIATSGALVKGASYWARPAAAATALYTYPTLVVTGAAGIVTGYTQTNYAATAKSYVAQQIRCKVEQGILGVANATVYKVVIYTK